MNTLTQVKYSFLFCWIQWYYFTTRDAVDFFLPSVFLQQQNDERPKKTEAENCI